MKCRLFNLSPDLEQERIISEQVLLRNLSSGHHRSLYIWPKTFLCPSYLMSQDEMNVLMETALPQMLPPKHKIHDFVRA